MHDRKQTLLVVASRRNTRTVPGRSPRRWPVAARSCLPYGAGRMSRASLRASDPIMVST